MILSARLLADGQTLELTFTQSSCVPPTVDPSAFRLSVGNTQYNYYSYYSSGFSYYTYYYDYFLPASAALPEQPEGSSVEATLATPIDISAVCAQLESFSQDWQSLGGLYLHYRSPGPDIVNSSSGAPLTDLAAWWVAYSVDAGNPEPVGGESLQAPQAVLVDVNCDVDGGV